MTEFTKVSKCIEESNEILNGISALCKGGDGYTGLTDVLNSVKKRLEDEKIRERLAKIIKRRDDNHYGDAMNDKITALQKKSKSVFETISIISDDIENKKYNSQSTSLPPVLKDWYLASFIESQYSSVTFDADDKWAGVLTIQGPKYSPFYGAGWDVQIDASFETVKKSILSQFFTLPPLKGSLTEWSFEVIKMMQSKTTLRSEHRIRSRAPISPQRNICSTFRIIALVLSGRKQIPWDIILQILPQFLYSSKKSLIPRVCLT